MTWNPIKLQQQWKESQQEERGYYQSEINETRKVNQNLKESNL